MNFALSNFKDKNKSAKVEQVAQAKGTRDLYGRLLYLSVQSQLDLHHVLSFPILPEPPCFAHPDRSLRDCPKSEVFHFLKSGLQTTPPESTGVFIADGMFLVHTLIQTCPTYGALARKMLSNVMKETTERADLCFDCFFSPSIKDVERKERGDVDSARLFSIGSKVKIEKDICSLLRISSFKMELLRFLSEEYEDHKYAPIIGEKTLICAINNEAKKYMCVDSNHVRVEIVPELFGSHEEADTRVAFHAKHADTFNPGNIVVRGNDTDIVIILVTNAHHFTKSQLWYDAGQAYNNTREYLDIKAFANHIKETRSLAGSYAFVGLDYSPSFFGKGKIRPMELIRKTERFNECFQLFGEQGLNDKMVETVEELVCCMYGYKKQHSINHVRYLLFQEKAKPKANKGPLDSIKSIDPVRFPPCQKVLLQQIKRGWFVANLYKTAIYAHPAIHLTPMDFGWNLSKSGDHFEINWFEGEQVPAAMEDLDRSNREEESTGVCNDDESDIEESDSDLESDPESE